MSVPFVATGAGGTGLVCVFVDRQLVEGALVGVADADRRVVGGEVVELVDLGDLVVRVDADLVVHRGLHERRREELDRDRREVVAGRRPG